MSIFDIRRQNLERLMLEFAENTGKKTAKSFADYCKKTPPQIANLKSGVDKMGEKVARQLESIFGKPRGWMDDNNDSAIIEEPKTEYGMQVEIPRQENTLSIKSTGPRYYMIDQKIMENTLDELDQDADRWCDLPTRARARLLMTYYEDAFNAQVNRDKP